MLETKAMQVGSTRRPSERKTGSMHKRSRRPDFSKNFPTRKAFEDARIQDDAVSKLTTSQSQAAPTQVQTAHQIVNAAQGRIENLLLTVPSTSDGENRVIESYMEGHIRTLAAGLGEDRRYTIVTHPLAVEQIREWFADFSQVELEFVHSPRFDFSEWAQDAYVGLIDQRGRPTLAEGILFVRTDDMTIADDVATQTDTGILQSRLYFQGGNVLGGNVVTLIGYDYIWKNLSRFGFETEDKVLDAFEALFGTEVCPIGGYASAAYQYLDEKVHSGYGYQPIFHIDMYVTRTGEIADSGKEIVLLGRPREAYNAVGKYSLIDEYDNPILDDYFQETANQLSDYFEVRELPLLLVASYDEEGSIDEPYYLSFNNVVLENYTDESGRKVRRVMMPTYSKSSDLRGVQYDARRLIEARAEEVWKSLKFEVHRMDDMEYLATGLGSIHCITKCIKRGAPDQSGGPNT